jgi:hypothetical protein
MKFRATHPDPDHDKTCFLPYRGLSMSEVGRQHPELAKWFAKRFVKGKPDPVEWRKIGKWFCKHAPIRRVMKTRLLESANRAVNWKVGAAWDASGTQDEEYQANDEAAADDDDYEDEDDDDDEADDEAEDDDEAGADDEDDDETFTNDETDDEDNEDEETYRGHYLHERMASGPIDFHVGETYKRYWNRKVGWVKFRILEPPYPWVNTRSGEIEWWALVQYIGKPFSGEKEEMHLDQQKHDFRL